MLKKGMIMLITFLQKISSHLQKETAKSSIDKPLYEVFLIKGRSD
jgi:hypothetical protein